MTDHKRDKLAEEYMVNTVVEGGNGEEMENCLKDFKAGYEAREKELEQARAEIERLRTKHRNIELANAEMTRNDHATFGALLVERRDLQAKLAAAEAKLKEFDEYYTFQNLERIELENAKLREENALLLDTCRDKEMQLREKSLCEFRETCLGQQQKLTRAVARLRWLDDGICHFTADGDQSQVKHLRDGISETLKEIEGEG